MPTNKNPNLSGSTNLNGWSKGGSSTTLTSTSEGARWVGGSSGTGRYIKIQVPYGPLDPFGYYTISNMQVRRNSGTALINRITCDGIFTYNGGGYSGIPDYGVDQGSAVTDYRCGSYVLPVGKFVTFPASGQWVDPYTYTAMNGASTFEAYSGAPANHRDQYFDVYIYASDNMPFDLTIRNVGFYAINDLPTQPALDAGDATFTVSQGSDSLTATGVWDKQPDEPVQFLKWTWGDGTSTSGATASVAANQSVSHTYPAPGVYTMSLTSSFAKIDGTTSTTTTSKQVTVPWGTFQAGFNYQSDYPQVLVDASSSVAPSLSPITTYAWNWGDGTTGSGKTASHTYDQPGSYNVTLTVSNPTVQRTSSITKQVTLSAPQLPVTAPQFAMQLFLDDPAAVTGQTNLQAEMAPVLGAEAIAWNWTRSEIPSMSFRAPTGWIGDTVAGVTQDTLRSDIVLRVNWGAGWYEPPSARFVINTVKADPLNPQEMVTVNCVGIAADDLDGIFFTPDIIGKGYTNDEIADGYQRLYSTAKPGAVLVDLLPVATTPGTGAPYLNYANIDFSATVDSKGVAWANTLDLFKVPADTSGLGLLQSLIDAGAIDWYCQKNLIRVFNPATGGKRGESDGVPELLPGRDISAAPQEQSPVRSQRWGAVVIGDKKVPYVVSDTNSSNASYQRAAYRGRRFVAIQAGDASSSAAALALAKPSLANIYRTKDGEMVRELRFYQDMPWMPLRDYWVGDTVYAPGPDGKLITVNVESITLTQSATAGVEGALVLGNAFSVNSLASKVASLQGGAGISIGSVRSNSGDTGWVDCAIKSGHAVNSSHTPQVRRVGGVVYMRGGLSSTGFSASATHATVITIPAGFRPPGSPAGPIIIQAGTSVGAASATVLINSNGSVDIRTNATLSSYYFVSGVTWLVD